MKILLLHANALHLGYLGCYGNEWVETPTLNRLAAEGVVFDAHFADCPTLDRSRQMSIRTGKYCLPRIDESAENVVADLSAFSAFSAVEYFASSNKDDESFLESLREPLQRLAKEEKALLWLDWPDLTPPWQVPEEILDLYFAADIREAEDPEGPPLLPWLDPPTGPLDVNDLERVQETYAAVVTAFDASLDLLLEMLDEHGGRDSWLLIVTAGCGLALGEHGFVGEHRAWLHEEIVHIPLIMRFPAKAYAGGRIAALTQPVDLLATMRDALQLPFAGAQAPTCVGRSLLPLVCEEISEVRPHAVSGLRLGDSVEWSLRTRDWAYLLPLRQPDGDPPRRPQLFVKPDDRWEVNDLSQHHLERCEEFEKTLRDFATPESSWANSATPHEINLRT